MIAQMQQTGVSFTDEQLDDKIQGIVKQMILDQQQKTSTKTEVNAKKDGSVPDISQYSDEERKARAKVLINIARTHHDK